MSTNCVIYRCSQQQDMYIYLRENLAPDLLPPELLAKTGRLSEVMKLDLHEGRKLARVDVARVIAALAGPGYFVQLPPNGAVNPRLNFGGG